MKTTYVRLLFFSGVAVTLLVWFECIRKSSISLAINYTLPIAEGSDSRQHDDLPALQLLTIDRLVNSLSKLLPQNFSEMYTNPCWVSNHSTATETTRYRPLRCFPAFFLLGYPKCGTTQLFNILQLHPGFATPLVKEPHWWSHSSTDMVDLATNFEKYLLKFNPAAAEIAQDPKKITGDCSASTAWWPLFRNSTAYPPHSIAYVFSRLFPHLKFIVIMRNPIRHMYSRFWYNCKLKKIDSPTNLLRQGPKVFEILAEQSIESFKRCTLIQGTTDSSLSQCSFRNKINEYKSSLPPDSLKIVQGRECGSILLADSLYYISLKGWLQYIPREKYLFLRTEDMAEDTVSVAQSVFRFLGLGEMAEAKLRRGIEAMGLSNVQNFTHTTEFSMTNRSVQVLTDFFDPYNKQLARLLKDERFLWR